MEVAVEKENSVAWSDTYSVGIKLLDDQHKGLLDFVNDLFSHATGNAAEEHAYFQKVIQQATQYISEHFVTEEECMLATNFPGYAEHKKAHDDFKFAVVKSVNEYNAGKIQTLGNFANFLKDWIASHVIIMDKQYSLYFRKIAAIKKDGRLSNVLSEIISIREKTSS
jgi:hemerythrin